jgi:hypothetical protein
MSRTIKAIERHMIPRSNSVRPEAAARQVAQPIQNGERKLVAEWQRGTEIWDTRNENCAWLSRLHNQPTSQQLIAKQS